MSARSDVRAREAAAGGSRAVAAAPELATRPAQAGTSVLSRMQRGLESLYRVRTCLEVDAFVVDEQERDRVLERNPSDGQAADAAARFRRPREQLLVCQAGPELGLALFVDHEALANLERHDPAAGLGTANFADFCLALEGVSHFVYLAVCAAHDRVVTGLELELQAEIDKFVSCVLVASTGGGDHDDGRGRDGHGANRRIDELRAWLFDGFRLASDLDHHERARYETANTEARRYARSLDRRFLQPRRIEDMLGELRRFYRLGLPAKLHHIAASQLAS